MPDDDWRYRKAQQLGLIDDRPLGAPGGGRRAAVAEPVRPRPEWTPAAPTMPVNSAIRPKASASKSDGPSRLAFVGGTALALLVAAGAGWLLNDAVGERSAADFPPPTVAMTDPEQPPLPASGVAAPPLTADTAPQPADMPPVPAPPIQEPPVETPPVEAPPMQEPAPAPVVAAARAVVAPPTRAVSQPRSKVVVAPGDGGVAESPRGRPSFNCRRARSRDSQLICASPELSGLDRELARSYRAAVRRGGAGAEMWLDRDQSAFLNARSACQTAPCIARLYYRRLDRLDR